MSENNNIQGLFDVSGNLTVRAMERYMRGELSAADRKFVERHLAESEFDREALEGMQKHASDDFRQEVEDLQAEILLVAGRKVKPGNSNISRRNYWYAAAGMAGLIGLSVLMFFLFREPVEKIQLAVIQPDTISGTATAVVKEDQKQSVSENDSKPVTQQVSRINIVEDDAPVEEKELATEPVVIINDDVIVEAELVAEEKVVGGIEASDETVQEEYIVTSEMAAPESSRTMSKMALDSEEDMAEESQIFMVVEQMPEFPGGEEALYKYLGGNITYPQSAKEGGVQGRVYVTFVVESDGTISDVQVLRGIGGGCDEEAIRVVKAMPKWVPGKQRGKPVRVQYNLPVKFSLE